VRYIREKNLNVIPACDLPALSSAALVDRIAAVFTDVPQVYVSFDIDVLDPACAPGTGIPIPGGISTRYLLDVLQDLTDRCRIPAGGARRFPPVAGFDMVEVSPPSDVHRVTALAARAILGQMLGLIAVQRGVATDILDGAN
jgi:agmatinase